MRRLCSEQRLASIGQMAAELAHEMNTPLSNILGYAQMAQARAQDADMQHRLEVIVEHARRLSRIVADMMAAVRPPLPKGGRVVMRDLLTSIARLTAPLLSNRGIALKVEADGGEAVVWADVSMTEQILFNLISNAFHASATHILLQLVPGEDNHCLLVEDDGSGIPDPVRERLFEPFVTGRRAGEGTGLGLAISQRLAREMGGELSLLSSAPGCTRFQLCLPQKPEERET
jgi:signal transduction histidine kinase